MSTSIKTERLTPNDIRKLKSSKTTLIGVSIFCVFFVAIAGFGFGDVLTEFSFNSGFDLIPFVFVVFFLSIPLFVIGYFVRDYLRSIKDVQNGMKELITGQLTQKETKVSRSSSKNGSRTTYTYYLYFAEQKFEVEINEFNKVSEGDTISIHRAPISQKVLAVDVLESSVIRAEDLFSRSTNRNPISANTYIPTNDSVQKQEALTQESYLSPEDKNAIQEIRVSMLKKAGRYLVIVFLAGLAIKITGFYGALFPGFFVMLFTVYSQFFKRISRYFKLSKELEEDTKNTSFYMLIDKNVLSTNGRTKYNFDVGNFIQPVSNEVYGEFQIGQKVGFVRTKSNLLFAVQTVDAKVYYL